MQTFTVPFGEAHVFYPEASEERCTAALLLDVDPVGLVRRGRGHSSFALAEYVNDRPYVASSFLRVALVNVFRSAMAGTCKGHEDLAAAAISLEASLPAVPARGGEDIVRRLFEPLGYEVAVTPIALDPQFPDWGESRHVGLRLTGELRLADLLNHLYVLLPVLDDDKHYWVDEAEIEKLMRRGEGWLGAHPERDLIVRRYLKKQARLVFPGARATRRGGAARRRGGARRARPRGAARGEGLAARPAPGHGRIGAQGLRRAARARPRLRRRRAPAAPRARGLRARGRRRRQRPRARAGRPPPASLDDMHDAQRARIELLHSPLTYRDKRLQGFDAAALVEVVEHLDPPRLAAAEQNVFGSARPRTVVVTTPNREYNVRWETLPAGQFRHPDHRFEWTRAEFAAWADGVGARHGYAVRYLPVGPEDPEVGPPTQMAVFSR